MADQEAALAARLGSGPRSAVSKKLTVDATVRRVTLKGGGWRLYGNATQAYYATRNATDAAGTLATGESAPSSLAASTAGSPGAGLAYDTGNGSVDGAIPLPTDATQFVEIAVAPSAFVNLYVSAGGAINLILVGPFL